MTSPAHALGFTAFLAVIFAFSFFGADYFAGEEPPHSFEDYRKMQRVASEPAELKQLRAKVATRDNKELADLELAAALLQFYKPSPGKRVAGREEAAALLAGVLKRNPNSKEALSELAKLAFENLDFRAAGSLLEQLVAIDPSAPNVLRLALTESFEGQVDKALSRIESILEQSPTDFEALSYKTIILARARRIAEAEVAGTEALKHAPDNEGKVRLEALLASLKQGAQEQQSTGPLNFERFLIQHQILAPKLTDVQRIGTETLKVFLKDFPIEKMPPFAKDSLVARFKEVAKQDPMKRVELIDSASGELLTSFELEP